MRGTIFSLILFGAVVGGCSKTNSPIDTGSSGAGSSGSGGASGRAGVGGRAGSAGSGGASGKGGVGGRPGSGGSAGGSSGIGGQAGSGGSKGCVPACGDSRDCCVDHCVNLQNDLHNCGACGQRCSDDEYCAAGTCVTRPCSTTCSGDGSCCGTECCAAGQLCCDPQGPISAGPSCLEPNEHGTCPLGCAPLCMCTDPETAIATPFGDRPIASLHTGDDVYSIDRGQLVIVPIVRIRRTAVSDHRVMRLTLQSGSVLQISPGHPTADGRRFETLAAGDQLDGVEIAAVEIIPYSHDATYDILPDSDTGAYFAGGVLIGSTLAQSPELVAVPTVPFEYSGSAATGF